MGRTRSPASSTSSCAVSTRASRAQAEYGAATGDSGSIFRASVSGGFGDLAKDRFNVLGNDQLFEGEGLIRPRSLRRLPLRPASMLTPITIRRPATRSPRTSWRPTAVFGTRNPSFPACPLPYAILSPLFEAIGSQGCRFDPSPLVALLPEIERVGIFTSGTFDLTPNVAVVW